MAAEKSSLAEFAGEWIPKPSLCGKQPKLDNEFPYEISKDGLRVGRYEDVCDVVKAKKIGNGTYSVRVSCESEGQPYLETQEFKFSDGSLSIDGGDRFYSCKKTEKKKPQTSSKVIHGRCSMDICGFFELGKIISKKKTRSGELLHSTYFVESVKASPIEGVEDQYANVKVPKFSKNEQIERVTHCSKQRPFSAVKQEDGKWFGVLLNLPNYSSAARMDSTSLYWAVCHNVFIGADQLNQSNDKIKKLGYNWEWPTDSDQIEFETMDDMIVFAKR